MTDSASPASEASADQEPSDTATTDAPATSAPGTSAFATSDRESEPPPEGDARWVSLPFRMTFPSSGNELNEQQRMLLREVTHTLSARRDVQKLRVEGHTDGRGADAVNDNLSLERARAVLEYLVQLGVPRDMLEAVGYGATSPITSDTSDLDRAQNRRVEFSILVVIP
ncbi:MAG: OmpA family protein, partial [Myxococcota bacterium]